MGAWRWAAASAIGTSHLKKNQQKQDSFKVKEINEGFVACVSDGAGSSSHSKLGSWLLCRELSKRFNESIEETNQLPHQDLVWNWIDEIRDKFISYTQKKEIKLREFACTLVLLAVYKDKFISMSLGDSCIVGAVNDVWGVIDWPENGEYASTTYFITDQPSPRIRFFEGQCNHSLFALFSDGLNDVALVNKEQRAFEGFFDPMFKPLTSSNDCGHLSSISQHLKDFLESDFVCNRTDDDKTLILISKI